MTYNYLNLALVHLDSDNPNAALPYLEQGLELTTQSSPMRISIEFFKLLSQAHRDLGDYRQALVHFETYINLRDSTDQATQALQVAELTERYQSAEKEKEIAQLKEKEQMQQLELEAKRSRDILLWSVLAVCTILLVAFIRYRSLRSREKQQEAQHQMERQAQQIRELEKDRQISVSRAMINGQEAERGRIARELHDGFGGTIAALRLELENIKPQAESREAHQEVLSGIRMLTREVRGISHDLAPFTLQASPFGKAVQTLVSERAAQYSWQVEFSCPPGIDVLDQNLLIQLYRIIQEALNNIVKHTLSDKVRVLLKLTPTQLMIDITDNGAGFDPEKVTQGLGLQNITSRCHQFGGDLHIASSPGNGTTLKMQIPLEPTLSLTPDLHA